MLLIFISVPLSDAAAETNRRRALYLEAKLRARSIHKNNFFLCAEAHLVYNIQIVGNPHPNYDQIRALHFSKLFNEMVTCNRFPDRIKLHRRRFSFALLRSREQNWNVDDSMRAHGVVYMFELFNKMTRIPHHEYPNEQAFRERLEILFQYMQIIMPAISKEYTFSHETAATAAYDAAEGEEHTKNLI